MLSVREPGRSPLYRLVARILIAALIGASIPATASASAPAEAVSLTKTAFGELIAHTGTDPQPYAFAGEPYDPNSGFQYHRARWMDPRSGRFLGMDPWSGDRFEPPTLHRYAYTRGDPVLRTDPSGLNDGSLASLTMAMSFVVTILGVHLPKLTTMLFTVADVLSPVELGLGPGQIGVGQLRKAAKTGGWQALRHLANTWRAWRARGGTQATGEAFEIFVGRMLKPGARRHVRILDGIESTRGRIPDWVDDAGEAVIEAKNSFATVEYEQALEIGHYAAERGFKAMYVFLKRPTQAQLDELSGWLAEGAQRSRRGEVQIDFTFLEP